MTTAAPPSSMIEPYRPAGAVRRPLVVTTREREDGVVLRFATETPMILLDGVIDRYIATWNERDPERRRDLIAQTWTEDARYVDPLVVAEGREAIEATIAAAQRRFPGYSVRLGGPIDTHHNLARFTWELAPGVGEEAIVVGFDVAVLAEDGRLRDVHGFLDRIPAL